MLLLNSQFTPSFSGIMTTKPETLNTTPYFFSTLLLTGYQLQSIKTSLQ